MIELVELTINHESGPLGALQEKLNEVVNELNLLKEKYNTHVHIIDHNSAGLRTSRPKVDI